MVMVLGFFSILAFTCVSRAAGHVTLAIIDDFFKQCRMKRLVKGWPSILFWLLTLVISMFFIAGIKYAWDIQRTERALDIFRNKSDVLKEEKEYIYGESLEHQTRFDQEYIKDYSVFPSLFSSFVEK